MTVKIQEKKSVHKIFVHYYIIKITVKFLVSLNPKQIKFDKHPWSPPNIFNRQNTLVIQHSTDPR